MAMSVDPCRPVTGKVGHQLLGFIVANREDLPTVSPESEEHVPFWLTAHQPSHLEEPESGAAHVMQEAGTQAGCSRQGGPSQRQRCQEERQSGRPGAVACGHIRGGLPEQRHRSVIMLLLDISS